ncbi:MAG: glycosyltransferase family 39 protein [Gemmatimonadota bacterium]|nr:glycosyltransferase family 39 protein [Gemmatimonadota bacterium]
MADLDLGLGPGRHGLAPPEGRPATGGMTTPDGSTARDRRPASEWDLAVFVLAGAALVRLAFSALIPLFPDETYYWEWSRRLAAGYFDHPWGIAALVRGGTSFGGLIGISVSPVTVRLLVIAAGFLASLFGAAIARRVGGDRAGLVAAMVFAVMPLAAAGMVLATPDVPLLLGTAAALYAVVRALQSRPRSGASLAWWSAAGVALGLAFSSKYTSIVLPVGVTLAVLTRRDLRDRLAEPGPYVACVAATLVFLPVLVWNAHHGWISFGFQLRHGLGTPKGSPLTRELSLVGGQAGLVTPILLGLLAIAVWRALRRPAGDVHYVLAVVTLTAAATFVVSALRKPAEANWPAPAYISAVPLLALAEWTPVARRWRNWGIGLAAAVSAVVYVQAVVPVLPLPAPRDPIARSAGWGGLAEAVNAADMALAGDGVHVWVAGDTYQDASELAFHLPGRPVTFSLNLSSRSNQYALWPGFPQRAHPGDDLVVVLDEVPYPHHTAVVLTPLFRSAEKGPLVPLRRRDGGVATQRRIWIFRGWSGKWVSP